MGLCVRHSVRKWVIISGSRLPLAPLAVGLALQWVLSSDLRCVLKPLWMRSNLCEQHSCCVSYSLFPLSQFSSLKHPASDCGSPCQASWHPACWMIRCIVSILCGQHGKKSCANIYSAYFGSLVGFSDMVDRYWLPGIESTFWQGWTLSLAVNNLLHCVINTAWYWSLYDYRMTWFGNI